MLKSSLKALPETGGSGEIRTSHKKTVRQLDGSINGTIYDTDVRNIDSSLLHKRRNGTIFTSVDITGYCPCKQ